MKPRCCSLALSCQENGSISESCSRKESYLYDRALTCICGWCGESLDAFLIPCNDFYGRIFSVLNAVLSDSPKMTSIQFWFWTLSLEYQDFSRSLGCVDDTAHDEIFSRHSFTLVNYSEIFPQLVEEFFVLLFLFVFQIIYLCFKHWACTCWYPVLNDMTPSMYQFSGMLGAVVNVMMSTPPSPWPPAPALLEYTKLFQGSW